MEAAATGHGTFQCERRQFHHFELILITYLKVGSLCQNKGSIRAIVLLTLEVQVGLFLAALMINNAHVAATKDLQGALGRSLERREWHATLVSELGLYFRVAAKLVDQDISGM